MSTAALVRTADQLPASESASSSRAFSGARTLRSESAWKYIRPGVPSAGSQVRRGGSWSYIAVSSAKWLS
jgi:hypothetical protein